MFVAMSCLPLCQSSRMNRLFVTSCLLLASLLASCVRAYDLAQDASRGAQVQGQAQAAQGQAGALPAVHLTADVLYRLLTAELAAQRDNVELASATLMDLARDTQDPRLAQRAFQFAMASRDAPSALAAARQWARLAPTDREASAALLALAASSGQTDGLAQALAQRITQAEDKDQAIAQAAGVVSRLRDKNSALRVLEQALLPAWQSTTMAALALADTAWAARDADRALFYARQAQQRDPASEDAAQRILEYGLAVDSETALAQTRGFLQANPQARQVHLLLINRLSARSAAQEAVTHVQAMRTRAPEDFDLLYVQAQVHARAQQFTQARALLDEYIQVQTQRRQSLVQDDSHDAVASVADARLLLVRMAEEEGDLDEALAQLDRVDDPTLEFQVNLERASLLGRQGKIAQARAALEAVAPRNSRERVLAALRLSAVYVASGRTDDAVGVLENAERQDPDSVQIQYDLAMLYERQGRMDAFEDRLQHILRVDPDHANANNALGYTLADQNRRLDEAQVLLERAEQLEPDNPYILDSVGWYHYRRGNLEHALHYLRRAWADMPAADVAAHLGEVLWMMRRPDEARTVWQEGLRAEPDNDTLRKTLKTLGVTLP